MRSRNFYHNPIFVLLLLMIACNDNREQKQNNVVEKTVEKTEKKEPPKKKADIQKPPIINIVDTVVPKRIIVYIRDSAADYKRISMKLGQIYGVKLADFFKKSGLKIMGPPMAWYSTQKAPFFFEAGMPVNKKPVKRIPPVNIKEMRADSAVVAHFYGPYDLIHVGYDALKEWMQDHRKNASAPPYEIYITDPIDKKGKPLDPYKVQTDIVFPRH